jgi:hypothetical protein
VPHLLGRKVGLVGRFARRGAIKPGGFLSCYQNGLRFGKGPRPAASPPPAPRACSSCTLRAPASSSAPSRAASSSWRVPSRGGRRGEQTAVSRRRPRPLLACVWRGAPAPEPTLIMLCLSPATARTLCASVTNLGMLPAVPRRCRAEGSFDKVKVLGLQVKSSPNPKGAGLQHAAAAATAGLQPLSRVTPHAGDAPSMVCIFSHTM